MFTKKRLEDSKVVSGIGRFFGKRVEDTKGTSEIGKHFGKRLEDTKVMPGIGKFCEKRLEEMEIVPKVFYAIGQEYGTYMKDIWFGPRQKAELMEGIERILEGEEIIDSVSGSGDGKVLGMDTRVYGVLVLTPKRILFYYLKGKNGYGSEDYPLDEISSINSTVRERGGIVKIHSNNNILEVYVGSENEDIGTFVKSIKHYIEKCKKENTLFSNNNLDIADQINKFAELRDKGILTEEEFTIQKRKLLGL